MGSISHGGHERGKRGDGDLTRARILESAGVLMMSISLMVYIGADYIAGKIVEIEV